MASHPECIPSARRRRLAILSAASVAACATIPNAKPLQLPEGEPVEVTTTEGVVRGTSDRGMHVFLGVPYGAPVDGIDRWLPPKPPAKRAQAFNAVEFGPACEQTVAAIPRWMLTAAGETVLYGMTDLESFATEKKSGDCLRLNIWTPELPDPDTQAAPQPSPASPAPEVVAAEDPAAAIEPGTEPASQPGTEAADSAATEARVEESKGLPVIVHLHGGGLTSGSGQHKGQLGGHLAKKGVIFVSINYRLGSIGFLAGDGLFEGELMKGNRGFMDTVRALEWVRDNIAGFGGDPSNVTLMGQSGGGTNVWSTLSSPKAQGLVRRAIIMSGPIYDYPIEEHKKLTQAVLEKWGAAAGDAESVAKIETDDAISTTSTTILVGTDEFGTMSKTLLPAAGATGTEFLPDDVFTAIEKGRFNNIDLLVGGCNDDAKVSILMVPLPNSMAIDIWNGYIGGLIADDDEGFKKMTDAYVGAMPEVSSTRAKEQLQTDALYRLRALKAASLHSEKTPDASLGRTYAYQFNWKSRAYPEDIGAMHGLDLIFASGNIDYFPAVMEKDGKIEASTQKLSDGMLEAWANFAKTGTPSSQQLPEWPEYEPGARQTMVFDKQSAVVADPGGKLRKLWE